LVVDDEPLNRDLLSRILEKQYRVSVAEDASEALEILESAEGADVQMVLCDHQMPGQTGVELAASAAERWPNLIFVLLTGADQDEEVLDAVITGGVAAVLAKPWRKTELFEAIARQLSDS